METDSAGDVGGVDRSDSPGASAEDTGRDAAEMGGGLPDGAEEMGGVLDDAADTMGVDPGPADPEAAAEAMIENNTVDGDVDVPGLAEDIRDLANRSAAAAGSVLEAAHGQLPEEEAAALLDVLDPEGVLGNTGEFVGGVASGAWGGVTSTVEGLWTLGSGAVQGGWAVATDPEARAAAGEAIGNAADAVGGYASDVWNDPARIGGDLQNVGDGVVAFGEAQLEALDDARWAALASGDGAAFYGEVLGRGAFEVGATVVPVGAAARVARGADAAVDGARAFDAAGNAGRALDGLADNAARALDDVPAGGFRPGSPEHKAQRWSDYQDRGGEWDYDRWSTTYDNNMTRAAEAHAQVDAYQERLGWGTREVTVEVTTDAGTEVRRLDIADVQGRRGVEHKTGYQSLDESNRSELARDAELVEQGWDIEWAFEGRPSQPLVDALTEAGITVTRVGE